ncbi:MAG: hypothetical protein ACXVLM_14610 [Ilumatobacteraceae bacterium]
MTRVACSGLLVLSVAAGSGATDVVSTAGAAAPPIVTVVGTVGATASAHAKRVTPPAGHLVTLPPGAALPSDATCASLVRPAAEVRSINTTFNHTKGIPGAATGIYARVTGNFTGTTDELIQWAACKWGFDEDIIRAQVAVESWWHQDAASDFTSDPTRCVPDHPIGADGHPGQCPESIGLLQIRFPYWQAAFPSATRSSAYNLDYALAARRSCFEGYETWLNTVERGRDYAAGDLWGCMGLWLAGRWYTQPAVDYIGRVQNDLAQRIWETPNFQGG